MIKSCGIDILKIDVVLQSQVAGVSLLFQLKLIKFHFCKQCCQIFTMDKHFEEKYRNKET